MRRSPFSVNLISEFKKKPSNLLIVYEELKTFKKQNINSAYKMKNFGKKKIIVK